MSYIRFRTTVVLKTDSFLFLFLSVLAAFSAERGSHNEFLEKESLFHNRTYVYLYIYLHWTGIEFVTTYTTMTVPKKVIKYFGNLIHNL